MWHSIGGGSISEVMSKLDENDTPIPYGLTQKQKAWAEFYCKTGDKFAALKAAGYGCSTDGSRQVQASTLKHHPGVQQYIADMAEDSLEVSDEELPSWLRRNLVAIGGKSGSDPARVSALNSLAKDLERRVHIAPVKDALATMKQLGICQKCMDHLTHRNGAKHVDIA